MSDKQLTAAQIEKGENLPPRLLAIGKEIEARMSKLDTYAGTVADMSDSIKMLLAEAEGYCNGSGFKVFRMKFCPSLGKSQAYELLRIAGGKKTLKEVRQANAARQAKHMAKLKTAAAQSVSNGNQKAAASDDSALRKFNEYALELVRITDKATPAEFAANDVEADDLANLGAFLTAVAALKKPAGNNAQKVVSLERPQKMKGRA